MLGTQKITFYTVPRRRGLYRPFTRSQPCDESPRSLLRLTLHHLSILQLPSLNQPISPPNSFRDPLTRPISPRNRPQCHKRRRVLTCKPKPPLWQPFSHNLDILVALFQPCLEVRITPISSELVVGPFSSQNGSRLMIRIGGAVAREAGIVGTKELC